MDCLSLDKLYLPAHPLVAMTLCVLAIFACCLALDLVRQGLFAVTVDRNRGHRFELVWNKATERLCVRTPIKAQRSSFQEERRPLRTGHRPALSQMVNLYEKWLFFNFVVFHIVSGQTVPHCPISLHIDEKLFAPCNTSSIAHSRNTHN
jgi:hypothetical protein